jgi:hypothetical protein
MVRSPKGTSVVLHPKQDVTAKIALYSSIASCRYPSHGQEHLPDRFLHVRLLPVVGDLVRPIGSHFLVWEHLLAGPEAFLLL